MNVGHPSQATVTYLSELHPTIHHRSVPARVVHRLRQLLRHEVPRRGFASGADADVIEAFGGPHLLRADADEKPFVNQLFDGLVVCDGRRENRVETDAICSTIY
jgi:hypothetical protein